jgi:tetratricopeptide (TPR) repeat protein
MGKVAPPQPDKPLHGYHFNPLDTSRRSAGIALSILLLGMAGLFVNWYSQTVKSLESSATKAGNKRAAKIQKLASHDGLRNALKPKSPTATPTPTRAPPYTPNLLSAGAVVSARAPTSPQTSAPGAPPPNGGLFARQVSPPPVTESVPAAPTPYVAPAPSLGTDLKSGVQPAVKNLKVPPDPADEKKANSKLYQAKKLEQEGKVRLATKLYQEILEKYPDTEAAKVAERHADKVVDTRVDKAQEQLAHARQYERTNSFEEAKAEYEGLIRRYPETEAAKEAKDRLEKLTKKK